MDVVVMASGDVQVGVHSHGSRSPGLEVGSMGGLGHMVQQPSSHMAQLMTQGSLQLVSAVYHLCAQLHSSSVPSQQCFIYIIVLFTSMFYSLMFYSYYGEQQPCCLGAEQVDGLQDVCMQPDHTGPYVQNVSASMTHNDLQALWQRGEHGWRHQLPRSGMFDSNPNMECYVLDPSVAACLDLSGADTECDINSMCLLFVAC